MLKLVFILFLISPLKFGATPDIHGQQPNLAVDTKGVIRMVYGDGESIYCLTSNDNGVTFSKPVLVAQVKGMHIGHTRGPQIASSKDYTMITAIDKEGKIHSFRLNHLKKTWSKSPAVNDVSGSAPEGLMGLTADKEDTFYATWLDIRSGKKNNIFFSSFNAKSNTWSKNLMVYKSPDEHVCECCKPNISFNNNKIAIGFRNWILGSRDIYYTVSTNMGKTFSTPKKSGNGTWQLNGCPMDGGGLAVSESGKVSGAWRRNSDIYYFSENQAEQKVGSGRDVSMSQEKGITVIAWQESNKVKVLNLNKRLTTEIGKGVSPKVYLLGNGKVICVWEDDKIVRYKVI